MAPTATSSTYVNTAFSVAQANLKADCVDSDTVDAIVHLGDHCYDLSMGDDLHGDAYMNAFQPVIAGCPWLPVIGNHESTSGAGGDKVDSSAEEHYLNQTWGVVMDSTAETGYTPIPSL